ncbi:sushi domain-containing protein 5 [Microcaecilia unicolor]|uniref:Sushi domain-containing protein 5 n=1 Tax=Microcaecilia unicolor TaxID=1415580 RepID=A0A6P7Y8U6_9AMPH|nr:sushi domain-containing protein 5 [Microcaecilia unicolor]
MALTFFLCLGSTLSLMLTSARADGKLFTVDSKNGTQGLDLLMAQKSCAMLGSRLATAEELQRAVLDCSFNICTKGWLADGITGTTVCSKTGTGPQNVKAIDVKTEANANPVDKFDAFCIKDEDRPCGDPPSFPHTTLHGHTGYEMGDELLYVCAENYIMGNREAAFTLLCDSCGEWYGQVQACVKDETEAHIDYDDNFPYHRTMPVVEPNQDNGGEEEEEEDEEEKEEEDGQGFSLAEDSELKSDKRESQDFEATEKESKAPTESPVSLLSQKHLFWFPSEAFNEPESEKETDFGTKTQFSNGDNRIGVKTDYAESETKMIYESEDFPLGPSMVSNNTNSAKDTVASTDGSWLDGYPVTQDIGQEAEKTDTSPETDEDVIVATNQPHDAKIGKGDYPATIPDKDLTPIWAAPTRILDYSVRVAQEPLTPTNSPENVSTSKGADDVMRYHPTAPLGFTTEALTTAAVSDEHTDSTPTVIMGIYHTIRPVDHIPLPTKAEKATTYQMPLETQSHTVRISDSFTERSFFEEVTEGENLTGGIRGTLLPSSEPCVSGDCLRSSNGPMITIIVVVLCLLLLATILAVWCYKKQQQKSSVYQLNGKGQTRHHQQIEMQKV